MQGGSVYKIQRKADKKFLAAKIYFTNELERINMVFLFIFYKFQIY